MLARIDSCKSFDSDLSWLGASGKRLAIMRSCRVGSLIGSALTAGFTFPLEGLRAWGLRAGIGGAGLIDRISASSTFAGIGV